MNQDQAARLFNLITDGPAVGADSEGNIVQNNTSLGTALHVLGKPNHISRVRMKDGKWVERINSNGVPYRDDYEWQVKEAATFLREWADALDQEPMSRSHNANI